VSEGRTVSGAIIYAATDGPISRRYVMDGFPIAVVAIDLGRKWREIHDEILNLPGLLSMATDSADKPKSLAIPLF
jgi:hypothetical protein